MCSYFIITNLSFCSYFIEAKTQPNGYSAIPELPLFSLDKVPSESSSQFGTVRVQWRPNNADGRSGSHFFVKHRVKGSHNWIASKNEINEDFIMVRGLEPEQDYEFRVVAVDGTYNTESTSEFIHISGDDPVIVKNDNTAAAGWFIGMILALIFLLLILCIICIVKRNRGGKYDVHDREVANGRRDFDEGGFHEYSQP